VTLYPFFGEKYQIKIRYSARLTTADISLIRRGDFLLKTADSGATTLFNHDDFL